VTDYHVITPDAADLVMQVIDGRVVIVPPVSAQQTECVATPGPVPAASTAESVRA
jgi:hypothetical protein